MIYRLENATAEHAAMIAPYLRDTDLRDISIFKGSTFDILSESVEGSIRAKTLFADGVPVMLFGLGKIEDDVGCPWMIGTEWIGRHGKEVFFYVEPWINDAFKDFNTLMNVTLPESVKSLKFLRFLGFTFGEPFLFNGVEVVPFKKEKIDV